MAETAPAARGAEVEEAVQPGSELGRIGEERFTQGERRPALSTPAFAIVAGSSSACM